MEKQHTETAEQSNTSENIEKNQNKANFSDITEQIKGTPFTMIGREGKYCLTVGMNRVTETFETEEEALNQLTTQFWNILTNLIIIVQKNYEELKKNNTLEA
ncbi:MAG: hypothetical protein [Microviridae sp.]|nr:MAG: hypothetical protein [Microviridae sp.]